jgi:foldase protein PrsA
VNPRVATAPLLTSVVLLVAAAPGTAGVEPVFTVTAPTGTYTPSTAEFRHWVRIARRSALGRTTRRQARWQAFEELLNSAWIDAEAAEQGLAVSDPNVYRAFLVQKRQSFPTERDFRRFLRDTGQTLADILRRVRLDLLANMIRERAIAPATASVTDAVVDDYIARHGHERVPERRDIRIVLTRRRAPAVQAKGELLRGRTWSSVARRYSIDEATSHRGGRLPDVPRGTLVRRLDRAVFRAPSRRVRGPVRTRVGYWVFRVSRIEPAHFLPEAASRRIIRRRLVVRAQRAALDRFVDAYTAKWTSRTVCAEAYRASRKCANRSPKAEPDSD